MAVIIPFEAPPGYRPARRGPHTQQAARAAQRSLIEREIERLIGVLDAMEADELDQPPPPDLWEPEHGCTDRRAPERTKAERETRD